MLSCVGDERGVLNDKTFFNTRWPLMTTLLEKKGWTKISEGHPTLSFADAGHSSKEKECKEREGKYLRMFSR